MLYTDLIDLPVEVFGGYCPAIPDSQLPPGAASLAQDVSFPMGGVRTRGGLVSSFGSASPVPQGASINGLKTYSLPNLTHVFAISAAPAGLVQYAPYAISSLSNTHGFIAVAVLNSGAAVAPPLFTNLRPGSGGFSGTGDSIQIAGAANAGYNGTFNVSSVVLSGGPAAWVLTVQFNLPGSRPPHLPTLGAGGTLGTKLVEVTSAATISSLSGKVLITGVLPANYDGVWPVRSIDSANSLTVVISSFGNPASGGGTISNYGQFATRLMVWDSIGNLYKDGPEGTLNLLFSRPYANLFYQSTTIFGREYQAFFNNVGAFDIPRQYDDTNWDRVSQSGPGAPPLAVDSGTAGNIAAGLHGVTVAFITRQGFITAPAVPPTFWTAAGAKKVSLTKIPTGPSNVVARLLMFTPVITAPATTGSFYSLPTGSPQLATTTMLIQDNTTTSITLDFNDTILIAGFQCNYLFTQLELGEMAFAIGYNSRLFWLGERNRISNVINMGFDGGFGIDGSSRSFPLGWTEAGSYAGGSSGVGLGDWDDAYVITGDGATATRGKITQSASQDYLAVPIIQANVAYGIRARVATNGPLTQGTFHINLQSTTGGFTTAGLAVTAAQGNLSNGNFAEYTANLTTAALATPPSDLLLQLYADGTPDNGGQFIVDSVEIYPLTGPFNYSVCRASHAFNPESYDSVTGQIQVRPSDGQQLRAGFTLRNNLYLAKDHYLCYVTDDGVNEPANWAVNEVSSTIGIAGPNWVDSTEEWSVFGERAGLHICWGSDPVKLTPEIQNDASLTGKITWASINWAAAYTGWVRIDKVNKMILVGAPVNGATTPNVVFMLDYRWLESASDIASSPMVTYSAFTGKILAHGRGRRWAIWNISANSMCFAERVDGTAQPFFGSGLGDGNVNQQIEPPGQTSDNGAAINSQYAGAGAPSHMEEQMLQLGAHRKLLGYLKWRAIGSGSLQPIITTAQRTTTLRPATLSMTPVGDSARPLNLHAERFFWQFGTNAPGDWFQLEKAVLSMKRDPAMIVSGVSP